MKDLTPDEIMAHGAEAQRLIDNPTLKLAFEGRKEKLLEQFADSKADETDIREQTYQELRALDGLMGELRLMRDNAEINRRKR